MDLRGAVVFDFNGVLIDDETHHFHALRRTVARLGIRLSRARYDDRYMTGDDPSTMRALLEDEALQGAASGAEIGELVAEKRRIYRELIGDGLRVESGVARLIRDLRRAVPLAIVSGAARAEVLEALRRRRLSPCFELIVAAGDVRKPKPHPAGYRRALRHLRELGVGGAHRCLVVEDSPGGIAAARAAGVERILGVATSRPARLLRESGAMEVVRSLNVVSAARILALLDRGQRRRRPAR